MVTTTSQTLVHSLNTDFAGVAPNAAVLRNRGKASDRYKEADRPLNWSH
jgi:hypothetical protein